MDVSLLHVCVVINNLKKTLQVNLTYAKTPKLIMYL